MELIQPGLGLIFWMTLSFGFVLFLLGKYAWKPIMKMLKEREESIDQALHAGRQGQGRNEKPEDRQRKAARRS